MDSEQMKASPELVEQVNSAKDRGKHVCDVVLSITSATIDSSLPK